MVGSLPIYQNLYTIAYAPDSFVAICPRDVPVSALKGFVSAECYTDFA